VPKWFKLIAYPSWFFLVFVMSIYLTFPVNLLKGAIISEAEKALGKDSPTKVGRSGVNPEVKIGDVSLYRVSGLSLERVRVQLASSSPDPGTAFDIDEANVRVGIFSALTGKPSISFNGKMYDGDIKGSIDLDDKSQLTAVDLVVDGLKLDRAPAVLEAAGVPVTGTLGLNAQIDMGPEPAKTAEGEINLTGTRLSVGPGDLKVLPGFGAFSVPLVDMGTLDGKIEIKKGVGESKTFVLKGQDLNADLELELKMGKAFGQSRLSGDGSFFVEKSFLDENSKFKTIFDITPQLKQAKDEADRYHYEVRGTLGKPSFKLSKNGGKSAKRR